jgi:dinuclear metal center YbgI/SA1388 family protein
VAEVAAYLDRVLSVSQIPDQSLNGLQVAGERPVRTVALAVDACLDVFQAAEKAGADLLIVHHGLFWGHPERLVGTSYQRLRFLFKNGMGLYASHLPLDLHPRLGNNALLARSLGLTRLKPFGLYHGLRIGFGGVWPRPLSLADVGRRLARITGEPPKLLAFGSSRIRRGAVVSGGAGDLALEAGQENYDVFITGEISHQVYHPSKELGISVVAGGHYSTETFGVRALGDLLKKTFNIRPVFLRFPTNL